MHFSHLLVLRILFFHSLLVEYPFLPFLQVSVHRHLVEEQMSKLEACICHSEGFEPGKISCPENTMASSSSIGFKLSPSLFASGSLKIISSGF